MASQRIQLEKNMQDLAVGIKEKKNELPDEWDHTKGMPG